MKESIIKFVLGFSFIFPGLSQFVNKDWERGLSLSISALAGLLMFILGGEKLALLGFVIMLIAWFSNFTDVINRAFEPIFRDLHEIAVSLERIADKMELIATQLKEINLALPKIEQRIIILGDSKKLLPAPKQFLLLPPGRSEVKVIILPEITENSRKLKEKSVT